MYTKANHSNHFTAINRSVWRNDAYGKVLGKTKYTDDLYVEGMLFAHMIRSPHAHARVLSIDTGVAKKVTGVNMVFTVFDKFYPRDKGKEARVFPWDKIRFTGEPVAMVVANSPGNAKTAASLVKVTYDVLEGVLNPEEALSAGAPKIHGDSNIACRNRVICGDVDKAFRNADVIVKREFKTQSVDHSYLETEIVIAIPEADGTISIIGSMKYPHGVRDRVAEALNISLDRVIVKAATRGGVFGGKDDDLEVMAVRAALAAQVLKKPVKIKNSREESFLDSTKRHPHSIRYELAAKSSGEILGAKVEMIIDAGAFLGKTPSVGFRTTYECLGPYSIPNASISTVGVFTNTHNKGAMRGFGSPQAVFASESMIDELAKELGKDPLDIRLLNALKDGDALSSGQQLNNVTVVETIRRAIDKANYKKKYNDYYQQNQNTDKKKGIGIASSIRGISLGGGRFDTTIATLLVQKDGSVTLITGISEFGQGSETAMRQIAADALGVPVDTISFVQWDTGNTPDSGPTVSSRGTFMHGNAIIRAAKKVKSIMDKMACKILTAEPEEIVRGNGYIWSNNAINSKVSFKDIASKCWGSSMIPYGIGQYSAPKTHIEIESGQGTPFFDYVYGTDIAEVEVDTKTGKVEVLEYTSVHDLGFVINPMAAKGQVYGGIAMGLGQALLEEIDRYNVLRVNNFDKYLIPTSMDMPRDVKVSFVESHNHRGPFGATSIAEPANSNVIGAVLNAISHATGKRVYELPASLEKVLSSQGGEL